MRKIPPFFALLFAELLAACGGEATSLPIPTSTPAPPTTPAPREVYPTGEPGAAVIHEEGWIDIYYSRKVASAQ